MAFRLICCSVLLLTTLVSNAWAQETIMALGGQASYLFPHSDSAGGKVDVEGEFMGGINFLYGYQNRGVELSVERVVTVLEGDTVDGKLLTLPVMISGLWRFHAPGRRLIPYMGVGVGIVINQFRNSAKTKALNLDNEIADTVGIQFLGGVEYFIRSQISISLNTRYLYAKADVQTEDEEENIKRHRIDLNTIISGIGIKKYF
jgi:outer membrane protein W